MKSLLLYDFVGLYLAIRCNPYYGYPIASKNEDTCDGCRKYLRWSLKVLTLVIESTFVGHRKYLRFFTHLFTYAIHLNSDVADARKNLTLHVMLDGDVDGVAGSKAIGIDGKIVLVITDTLSLGSSTLVYQVALYGIRFFCFLHTLKFAFGEGTLIYDKRKTHEGVDSCHPEP